MFKNRYLFASVTLCACFASNAVFAKDYTVIQKDKSFMYEGGQVQTIAVKNGDTIHFRNEDSVFHNIFSLSKTMPFNLGAYEKGKTKSVNFNKTGTVNVECAIHPRMMIEVVVD